MTAIPSIAFRLCSIIPAVELDPDLSGVPPVQVEVPALDGCLFSIRDMPNAVETVARFLTGGLPEEATFLGGYVFITDMGLVPLAVEQFCYLNKWDRALTLIRRTSPVPVQLEHPCKLIRSGGVLSLYDHRNRCIAGPEELFLSEAEAAVRDMRTFSRALRSRLRSLVREETLRCYFGELEEAEQNRCTE